MAGRPPRVDHVREALLREIGSSQSLISAIQVIPLSVRFTARPHLHPKYTRQVVELAFMGMVSAWEEFLERSLVRYVAGAQTASGFHPTHKFGKANNLGHAYELLSQDVDYNPTKHYLKVTDPRWVWRTADFFFSQHPYSGLSQYSDLLKHGSSIRNRVAHSSEKCRTDFKATVVYFLHPAGNALAQGYGAGDLLMTSVQRHFAQQAIQRNLTHFQAYAELYESLARQIVP